MGGGLYADGFAEARSGDLKPAMNIHQKREVLKISCSSLVVWN